jgi:hypothetical protein
MIDDGKKGPMAKRHNGAMARTENDGVLALSRRAANCL